MGTATVSTTPRAHWGASVREHRVVATGHGPQPDPCAGSAALAQAAEASKPLQPVRTGSAAREADSGRPNRTPHQDSPGGLAVFGHQLCHGLDRVGLLGSALGTVVVF